MANKLSVKTKTLSIENRMIFMQIAKNKFGLTTNQYRARILGRVDWSLNQEIFLNSCLVPLNNGKYEIKQSQEVLDLAGITYPINEL